MIRLLKTHVINYKRKDGNGHYMDGQFVYKLLELETVGSIQPITGEDLKLMLEFAQNTDKKKVWSQTELMIDDEIVYKEKVYRVIKVKDYEGYCLRIENYECFIEEVIDNDK